MSQFDDPTPTPETPLPPLPSSVAMPANVDQFLEFADEIAHLVELAEQVERDEVVGDAQHLLDVQHVQGVYARLHRLIAEARTAWRCAERDEQTEPGEYDRWAPVMAEAERLVEALTGGVAR